MALVPPAESLPACSAGNHAELPYVHPSISNILLQAKPIPSTAIFLRGDAVNFPQCADMQDLIYLSYESDKIIFSSESIAENDISSTQKFETALLKFTETHERAPHASMIATLLAVSHLESVIRNVTGYRTGQAPLLQTMISQLPEPRVFELLLTASGLNLWNLLWHGFVAEMPRRWLSLLVVLTRSLLAREGSSTPFQDMNFQTPGAHMSSLNNLQAHVLQTATTTENILSMRLPEAHLTFYQGYIRTWILEKKYPATCCALLTVILEHELRLNWCRTNDRPKDVLAQPGQYYVTLDGHGQLQLHDLLLHPYLLDGSANRLVTDENASTMALLTDVFCSPSGGPNIRAAISHGLWDPWLLDEWCHPSPQEVPTEHPLWRTLEVLMFTVDAVASKKPILYQPRFSYTATTRKASHDCQSDLSDLIRYPAHNSLYKDYLKSAQDIFGNMLPISVPKELVGLQANSVILSLREPLLASAPSEWGRDLLFAEHALNQKLADLGLVRSLLNDISIASERLLEGISSTLVEFPTLSSRKKKSALRFVYLSSMMGIRLYIVAYNIAVLALNDMGHDKLTSAEYKKALQRTRMVVSTTDTLLRGKVDRARNSIIEYCKGKAVQQVCCTIAQEIANGK